MKKFKVTDIASIMAGCVLGAGYVSGQELWQFYGAFGKWGILGLSIAMLLIPLFSYMIASIAQKTGRKEMDYIVVGDCPKIIRNLLGVTEVVFVFFVIVIMVAGNGSLFHSAFGFPKWVGGLILSVLILLPAMFGISGMKKTFSYIVPVLTVSTVVIGVWSYVKCGGTLSLGESVNTNALLPNAPFAAVTFVSYNLLCCIGILAVLSTGLDGSRRDKRHLASGLLLGMLMLTFIALSILLPVLTVPGAKEEDLPMLAVSFSIGKVMGYFYALLLFLGIFGTTVSMLVEIPDYISQKVTLSKTKERIICVLISLTAFLGGLFGFSELISVVYPLFGYFGFLVMLGIVIHFVKLSRQKE